MRVLPSDGETLPSHVDRLAKLYDSSLRSMLDRLGVGETSRSGNYGIILSDHAKRQYAFVSGLLERDVADMLLYRYAETVVTSEVWARPSIGREWLSFKGSHFCPECLKDTGGVWLSSWKLSWSFACVKHGTFLIDTCPACRRRPRVGGLQGLYPVFRDRVPEPTLCNNSILISEGVGKKGALRPQPCGCSFIDLQPTKASNKILCAQDLIDQKLALVNDEAKASICNFFGDLKVVSSCLALASECEDFESTDPIVDLALDEYFDSARHLERLVPVAGKRSGLQALTAQDRACVGLMAGITSKAISILSAESQDKLEEEVAVLAKRIYSRPKSNMFHRLPSNIALALKSYSRYDRVGALSRNDKQHRFTFESRNVPQLFPLEDYNLSFARIFAEQTEITGRRICSLAAIKLLGFTWAEATQILELPMNAVETAQTILSSLKRAGRFADFVRELRRWALELSHAPDKTDFQIRRDALRSAADFPVAKWKALCERGGIAPGHKGRSKYAAAWMWADATGGDWRLAPSFRRAFPKELAKHWKRMMKIILPNMEAVLRAEADRRVERYRKIHRMRSA